MLVGSGARVIVAQPRRRALTATEVAMSVPFMLLTRRRGLARPRCLLGGSTRDRSLGSPRDGRDDRRCSSRCSARGSRSSSSRRSLEVTLRSTALWRGATPPAPHLGSVSNPGGVKAYTRGTTGKRRSRAAVGRSAPVGRDAMPRASTRTPATARPRGPPPSKRSRSRPTTRS